MPARGYDCAARTPLEVEPARRMSAQRPDLSTARRRRLEPSAGSGPPAPAAYYSEEEPVPRAEQSVIAANDPAVGPAVQAGRTFAAESAESAGPAASATADSAPSTTVEAATVPTPAPGTDWTSAELAAVRADLVADLAEMQREYERSVEELNDLQVRNSDGAGDDQADAGSKTFDREHNLSIAANRLDLISQLTHAIERVDRGTYGLCEVCGKAIPRVRLEAFPMATLDVECKQREERR